MYALEVKHFPLPFFQEKNQMVKYGLRPRTLKGELFALLSKAGSGGLKVSVLAKSSEVFILLILEINHWY